MWGFFLSMKRQSSNRRELNDEANPLTVWQAACKDFKSLAALRILGGAAEACADPAFMLITSMWCRFRAVVHPVLQLIFPRY